MNMLGMRTRIGACALAIAALCLGLAPRLVRGQCAKDVTAVVLVSGIYPGTTPQIELLHVSPTPAPSNPTNAELLAAVQAVYATDPFARSYYHFLIATLGDYDLYFAEASDFGAATIIDRRSADVLFAGTIVWMGRGAVVEPSIATHPGVPSPGDPASSPGSLAAFPNAYWWDPWGTAAELAQAGVALAARTDFVRNMAGCGDYAVTGFVYTPTVGATNPNVAMEILILRGRVDDSWVPVAIEAHSWGSVKALYR